MFRSLLLAAALFCVFAGSSSAATLSYDGDTFVYTGEGTEANDIILGVGTMPSDSSPAFQLADYGPNPLSGPSSCEQGGGYIYCPLTGSFRFVGNAGNDEAILSVTGDFPAAMPVTLLGGDGDDTLKTGKNGTVGRTADGGSGADLLEGGQGPDQLLGGDGGDRLIGLGGGDELRAGAGNDELIGDGRETPAGDVLDGGDGFDTIKDDWNQDGSDTHQPTADVSQDGVANDGRAGEGDNVIGVEKLVSYVRGTYEGTAGNDDILIWGNNSDGATVIRGLAGDDTLGGLWYAENIDGGPGADTLNGGFGDDTITGGPGKDTILADGGQSSGCSVYGDSCEVPSGNDTVLARDGEVDSIDCGVGTDRAVVDTDDVVASNCETIERPAATTAGGGTAGGGTAGGGTAGGGTAGGDTISTSSPKHTLTLSGRTTTRRVAVRLRCPGACRLAATLTYKGKRVGRANRSLLKAGTTTLTIKPSSRIRWLRRAKVTLKVVATDSAGKKTTLTKTLTLRR